MIRRIDVRIKNAAIRIKTADERKIEAGRFEPREGHNEGVAVAKWH